MGDLQTEQGNALKRQLAPRQLAPRKTRKRQLAPDSKDNSSYFVSLNSTLNAQLNDWGRLSKKKKKKKRIKVIPK